MRKQIINILFLIGLLTVLQVQLHEAKAEKYRIVFMNCNSIKIGNKIMKLHDVFDSSHTIYWTNGKQMLKVKPLGKDETLRITCHGFNKHKVKTLVDYLIRENGLATRDVSNGNHYIDNYFYLNDSLHFIAFSSPSPSTITEAVWSENGAEYVTPIHRTADNKFYIIDTKIYKNLRPHDINLNIRERDKDGLWVDNVYQGIHIIYIPLKIK